MTDWIETTEDVKVGDFLQYALVTDTRVVEVVAKTAKTLTLRPAQDGDTVRNDNIDGNPWPVTWTAQVADHTALTFQLRQRKVGGFRYAETYGQLYPAHTIDGVPVRKTDYRF